ncbi:MAG: hypothetical protein LBQ51_07175 [Desulfovibrio sp.]|nr:hypothetical protein [Desulfovibrio sp.]
MEKKFTQAIKYMNNFIGSLSHPFEDDWGDDGTGDIDFEAPAALAKEAVLLTPEFFKNSINGRIFSGRYGTVVTVQLKPKEYVSKICSTEEGCFAYAGFGDWIDSAEKALYQKIAEDQWSLDSGNSPTMKGVDIWRAE